MTSPKVDNAPLFANSSVRGKILLAAPSSSTVTASEDSSHGEAPSIDDVLGVSAFCGGKKRPPPLPTSFACGRKTSPYSPKMDENSSLKKKKQQQQQKKQKKTNNQASHFRRLRMSNPSAKKRPQPNNDPEDEEGNPKKRKCGVSEPDEVRAADSRMLEPHPAVLFMREHTPVRPCGRCRKCRGEPCGQCSNCKNNAHLTDRSHDRKRCTALGCTRLSDEEIERYRLAHDSADSISKIESDLRALRDRFMAATTRGATTEEIEVLNSDQEKLMERLDAIGHVSDAILSENAPEGYGCLLLSFQTLETERDRISRLIERRTTRDSPEIMHTRRQLRNFYALTICNMVRMFANDVVARPHVDKLRKISEEYEKEVCSLPISV